ncbi:MAG: YlbF family regulator [Planctomycetes bacterium]|nr:YlbF family regulator [Planctomycetota bacterium]
MADTKELMAQAQALGNAIAGHARVRDYLAARQAVQNSVDTQTLLRDYQQHTEHIRKLEAEQKPIEVADKQKLAALEHRMSGDDALKSLMRSQADYAELMTQINRAMEAALVAAQTPGESK